jgi:hypothetical protein
MDNKLMLSHLAPAFFIVENRDFWRSVTIWRFIEMSIFVAANTASQWRL